MLIIVKLHLLLNFIMHLLFCCPTVVCHIYLPLNLKSYHTVESHCTKEVYKYFFPLYSRPKGVLSATVTKKRQSLSVCLACLPFFSSPLHKKFPNIHGSSIFCLANVFKFYKFIFYTCKLTSLWRFIALNYWFMFSSHSSF